MFRSSSAPILRYRATIGRRDVVTAGSKHVLVYLTTTSAPSATSWGSLHRGAQEEGESRSFGSVGASSSCGQRRFVGSLSGAKGKVKGRAGDRRVSGLSSAVRPVSGLTSSRGSKRSHPPGGASSRHRPPADESAGNIRGGSKIPTAIQAAARSPQQGGGTWKVPAPIPAPFLTTKRDSYTARKKLESLSGAPHPNQPTDFVSAALLAQRFGVVDIASSAMINERLYGRLLGESNELPQPHSSEQLDVLAQQAVVGVVSGDEVVSEQDGQLRLGGEGRRSRPSRRAAVSGMLPPSGNLITAPHPQHRQASTPPFPLFPVAQVRAVVKTEADKTSGFSSAYPSSRDDNGATPLSPLESLPLTSRLLSVRFIARCTAATLLPLDCDAGDSPYFPIKTIAQTPPPSSSSTDSKHKGGKRHRQRAGDDKSSGEEPRVFSQLQISHDAESSVLGSSTLLTQPPIFAASSPRVSLARCGSLLATFTAPAAKPLFFGPSPRMMMPVLQTTHDKGSTENLETGTTHNVVVDTTVATPAASSHKREELLNLDLHEIFIDYFGESAMPTAEDVGGDEWAASVESELQHGEEGGEEHSTPRTSGGRKHHRPLGVSHAERSPVMDVRVADALHNASRFVTTYRRIVDGGVTDVSSLHNAVIRQTTSNDGGSHMAGVVNGGRGRAISVPIHTRAPIQFPCCADHSSAVGSPMDAVSPSHSALSNDALYSLTGTASVGTTSTSNDFPLNDCDAEDVFEQLSPWFVRRPTNSQTAGIEMEVDVPHAETTQDEGQTMQGGQLATEEVTDSARAVVENVPPPPTHHQKEAPRVSSKVSDSSLPPSPPPLPYHQRLLARLYFGKFNALQQRDMAPHDIDQFNNFDPKTSYLTTSTMLSQSTTLSLTRQPISRHGFTGAPSIAYAFGERDVNGEDVEDALRRGESSNKGGLSEGVGGVTTFAVSDSLTGKALAAFASALEPVHALQLQLDAKLKAHFPRCVVASPVKQPHRNADAVLSPREPTQEEKRSQQTAAVNAVAGTLSEGVDTVVLSLLREWITERVTIQGITTIQRAASLVPSALSEGSDSPNNTTTTDAVAAHSNTILSEAELLKHLVLGGCGSTDYGANMYPTQECSTLDALPFVKGATRDMRPESVAVLPAWMRALAFASFHRTLERKGVRSREAGLYQSVEDSIISSSVDTLKKTMLEKAASQYRFHLNRIDLHAKRLEGRKRKGRYFAHSADSTNSPLPSLSPQLQAGTAPGESLPGSADATPISQIVSWFKQVFSCTAVSKVMEPASPFALSGGGRTVPPTYHAEVVWELGLMMSGLEYLLRKDNASLGSPQAQPLLIYLPLATTEFRTAFSRSSNVAVHLNQAYNLPASLSDKTPSTRIATLLAPPTIGHTTTSTSLTTTPLIRLIHCENKSHTDGNTSFAFDSMESLDVPPSDLQTGTTSNHKVAIGAHSRKLAIASVFGKTAVGSMQAFHSTIARASMSSSDPPREITYFLKKVSNQHLSDRQVHHNVFHQAAFRAPRVGGETGVAALEVAGVSLQESQVDWLFRTAQHVQASSTWVIRDALGRFGRRPTALSDPLSHLSFATMNIGSAGGVGATAVLRQIVDEAAISLGEIIRDRPRSADAARDKGTERDAFTRLTLLETFQKRLHRDSANQSIVVENGEVEELEMVPSASGIVYDRLYSSASAVTNTHSMEPFIPSTTIASPALSPRGSAIAVLKATTATTAKYVTSSSSVSDAPLKFADHVLPFAMSLCVSSGQWWKAVYIFNKLISNGIQGRTPTPTLGVAPSQLHLALDGGSSLTGYLEGTSTSAIEVAPSSPDIDDDGLLPVDLSSTMDTDGVRSFDVPPSSLYMLAKAVGTPYRQQWYASEILMGIAGSRVAWQGSESIRRRFLLEILHTHVSAFRWKDGLEFVQDVGLSNILSRPDSANTDNTINYPASSLSEFESRLEGVLVVAKLVGLIPSSCFGDTCASIDGNSPATSIFEMKLNRERSAAEEDSKSVGEIAVEDVDEAGEAAAASLCVANSELSAWMERVRAEKSKLRMDDHQRAKAHPSPKGRKHREGEARAEVPSLEMTLNHVCYFAAVTPQLQQAALQSHSLAETMSRVASFLEALRNATVSMRSPPLRHHLQATSPPDALLLYPTKPNHLLAELDHILPQPRRTLVRDNSSTTAAASSSDAVSSALIQLEMLASRGDWKGVFSTLEEAVREDNVRMTTCRARIDSVREEIVDVVLAIFAALRGFDSDTNLKDDNVKCGAVKVANATTISNLLNRFATLEALLYQETRKLYLVHYGAKDVLLAPHFILTAESNRLLRFADDIFEKKKRIKRSPPRPSEKWIGLVFHMLNLVTLPTFGFVHREGTRTMLENQHTTFDARPEAVLDAAEGQRSWVDVLGSAYPCEESITAAAFAFRDSSIVAAAQQSAIMSVVKSSLLHINAKNTLPRFKAFTTSDGEPSFFSLDEVVHLSNDELKSVTYTSGLTQWSDVLWNLDRPALSHEPQRPIDRLGCMQDVWFYLMSIFLLPPRSNHATQRVLAVGDATRTPSKQAVQRANVKVTKWKDVPDTRRARFTTRYVEACTPDSSPHSQAISITVSETLSRTNHQLSKIRDECGVATKLAVLVPSSNPFVMDAQVLIKHVSARYGLEALLWGEVTPGGAQYYDDTVIGCGAFRKLLPRSQTHVLKNVADAAIFALSSVVPRFTATLLTPALPKAQFLSTFQNDQLQSHHKPAAAAGRSRDGSTSGASIPAPLWVGLARNTPSRRRAGDTSSDNAWLETAEDCTNNAPAECDTDVKPVPKQYAQWGHLLSSSVLPRHNIAGSLRPYAYSHLLLEVAGTSDDADPGIGSDLRSILRFYAEDVLSTMFSIVADVALQQGYTVSPPPSSTSATTPGNADSMRIMLEFACGLCSFGGPAEALAVSSPSPSASELVMLGRSSVSTKASPTKERGGAYQSPKVLLLSKASFLQLSALSAREAFTRMQWQAGEYFALGNKLYPTGSFHRVELAEISHYVQERLLRTPPQLTDNCLGRPTYEAKALAAAFFARLKNPSRAPPTPGELLSKRFFAYCESQLSSGNVKEADLTSEEVVNWALVIIGQAHHAILRNSVGFLYMAIADSELASKYFALTRLLAAPSVGLEGNSRFPVLPPIKQPPAIGSEARYVNADSSSRDAPHERERIVVHCTQRFWHSIGTESSGQHHLLPLAIPKLQMPVYESSSLFAWKPVSERFLQLFPRSKPFRSTTFVCEVNSSSFTTKGPAFGVTPPTLPLTAELLHTLGSLHAAANLSKHDTELILETVRVVFARMLSRSTEGKVFVNYLVDSVPPEEMPSSSESLDATVNVVSHRDGTPPTALKLHKLRSITERIVEPIPEVSANKTASSSDHRNSSDLVVSHHVWMAQLMKKDSASQQMSVLKTDEQQSRLEDWIEPFLTLIITRLLTPTTATYHAVSKLFGLSVLRRFLIASAAPNAERPPPVKSAYMESEVAVLYLANVGHRATHSSMLDLLKAHGIEPNSQSPIVIVDDPKGDKRCFVRLESHSVLSQARAALRGVTAPGATKPLITHRSSLSELSHAQNAAEEPRSTKAGATNQQTFCVYMQGFPENYEEVDVRKFVLMSPTEQIAANLNRRHRRASSPNSDSKGETKRIKLEDDSIMNIYLLPKESRGRAGFIQVNSRAAADALVSRDKDFAGGRFIDIKASSLDSVVSVFRKKNVDIDIEKVDPNAPPETKTGISNVLVHLRDVSAGSQLGDVPAPGRKKWVRNIATETLLRALRSALVVTDELVSQNVDLVSTFQSLPQKSALLITHDKVSLTDSPFTVTNVSLARDALLNLEGGNGVILFKPCEVSAHAVCTMYMMLQRLSNNPSKVFVPAYDLSLNASGLLLCTSLEVGRLAASGVSVTASFKVTMQPASDQLPPTITVQQQTLLASSLLDTMLFRTSGFSHDVWYHPLIGGVHANSSRGKNNVAAAFSAREATRLCFGDYLVEWFRLNPSTENESSEFFSHFLVAQRIARFFYEWALGSAFEVAIATSTSPPSSSCAFEVVRPASSIVGAESDDGMTRRTGDVLNQVIERWCLFGEVGRKSKDLFTVTAVSPSSAVAEREDGDVSVSAEVSSADPVAAELMAFQREVAELASRQTSASAPNRASPLLKALPERRLAVLLATLVASVPRDASSQRPPTNEGWRLAPHRQCEGEQDGWYFNTTSWKQHGSIEYNQLCDAFGVFEEHRSWALSEIMDALDVALDAEQGSKPASLPPLQVVSKQSMFDESTPFSPNRDIEAMIVERLGAAGWCLFH